MADKNNMMRKSKKTSPKRSFDIGVYEKQRQQLLNQQARKVEELYKRAVDKIVHAAYSEITDAAASTEFRFKDFPALGREAEKYIDELGKSLQLNIRQGDMEAWTLATTKNDAVVKSLVTGYGIPEAIVKDWTHPHLEALSAFMARAKSGMNLSNGGNAASSLVGVWNLGQFKNELELALQLGIGSGKSAAELSRDVRKFLKHPDKLFRRVRGKNGVLRLSKVAAAFHPGQGVYRSSYKNALRLTATENNMAYRTADHESWAAIPFVLGIEIRLSNNHPVEDICDELAGRYPKEFKFVGWHPWCRCYAVPVLADKSEVDEYCRRMMNGEDVSDFKFTGRVTDMPEVFTNWLENNEERIAKAKSQPYFIKDNFHDGNPKNGVLWKDKTVDKKNKPNEYVSNGTFDSVIASAKAAGVQYREVSLLDKPLTEAQIVEKIAGGDKTKGSCSSLAFAYSANKAGLDVLDFRGGNSWSFFATKSNIKAIAEQAGGIVSKGYNDFVCANEILKNVENGKEYYFAAAKHAAMIRKQANGRFEFLELQSSRQNGWKEFNGKVFKDRFSAKKSHTSYGMKMEYSQVLIDFNKLTEDKGALKELMGYINTEADKQLKGAGGSIK